MLDPGTTIDPATPLAAGGPRSGRPAGPAAGTHIGQAVPLRPVEVDADRLTTALVALRDAAWLLPLENRVNKLLAQVPDLATVLGRRAGIPGACGDMIAGRKGPSGTIPDLVAVNETLLAESKATGRVNYDLAGEFDQLALMRRDRPQVPIVVLLLIDRPMPAEAERVGARAVHGIDLAEDLTDTYPAVARLLRHLWTGAVSAAPLVLTPAHRGDLLASVLTQARRTQVTQKLIADDLRAALGADWSVRSTDGRTKGSLGWTASCTASPGPALHLAMGTYGSAWPPMIWCHDRAAVAPCRCSDWPEAIPGPGGARLVRSGASPYPGSDVPHAEYLLHPPTSDAPLPSTGAGLRAEVVGWLAGIMKVLVAIPATPLPSRRLGAAPSTARERVA